MYLLYSWDRPRQTEKLPEVAQATSLSTVFSQRSKKTKQSTMGGGAVIRKSIVNKVMVVMQI